MGAAIQQELVSNKAATAKLVEKKEAEAEARTTNDVKKADAEYKAQLAAVKAAERARMAAAKAADEAVEGATKESLLEKMKKLQARVDFLTNQSEHRALEYGDEK